MSANSDGTRKRLSRANRDREYLYKQLADIIQAEIDSGKYKPGDRLPSMDTLAAQYKVNKVTVRRAIAELSQLGLIYSVPAQGTYISEPTRARAQSSRKPFMTIGLLSPMMVPGNTGFYHLEIIEGIREELDKNQANLVILPVKYVQPQTKIIELLVQSNLDGVILLGHFDPVLLRRMLNSCPPSILLDHVLRGANIDTILVDNRDGGYQAMEYLLRSGHRRLAMVTGPQDQIVTQERMQGAQEALSQYGISLDSITIVESNFMREGGFQAVTEILKSGESPTGIFLLNDEMAAGALQALHSFSSFTVPEDISIIGFDDTSLAMATQPPLTTIQVSKALMGRLAVQRLLNAIRDEDHEPTTVMVPTQLMIRNSTATIEAESEEQNAS
jgi:LacI family transcriptional regulator